MQEAQKWQRQQKLQRNAVDAQIKRLRAALNSASDAGSFEQFQAAVFAEQTILPGTLIQMLTREWNAGRHHTLVELQARDSERGAKAATALHETRRGGLSQEQYEAEIIREWYAMQKMHPGAKAGWLDAALAEHMGKEPDGRDKIKASTIASYRRKYKSRLNKS